MRRSFFTLIAVLAAALGMAGCTVHKQDAAPPLTGPSETAISITVTLTPDVLTQDGLSQSLVSIQAFGPNGQPQRSLPLRAEIFVGGAFTDFGSLSARNIVTDGSGRASVTYTAPPPPVFNNDAGTTVEIVVTPVGGNFENANPRSAVIRLVPPGVVGPPLSSLRPDFVAPSATQGNPAVFTATVVDSSGRDATGQVTQYLWNFDDGDVASGRSVTHAFDDPGTFGVTLTIVDTLGRGAFITKSITIGQGQLPNATFVTSPGNPVIDQLVNFNATGSTAEPGHRIVDYSWNFGDGQTGSGQVATHAFKVDGTYNVTLVVTDDVGRQSAVQRQAITVGTGDPDAQFTAVGTFSAPPGNFTSILFDASTSKAAPGRTIVDNQWTVVALGGGAQANLTGQSADGKRTTVTYDLRAPGTYNVTLTVTDNTGKKDSTTQNIQVASTTLR